jgi:uncharacterized glyoxalase superfamily protein PhnB
VIASSDVLKTVAYFVQVLGFEQQWIWGEPPVYAAICAGQALIYISHDPVLARAILESRLAPDVYFWVEEIESLYARHAANGARILEKLETRPWGTRQYSVLEPNGYHLKIAESESG